MNYQRIIIILLVVFTLWYLFFRRFEPLTLSRIRTKTHCARVKCPEEFVDGVICWECYKSR